MTTAASPHTPATAPWARGRWPVLGHAPQLLGNPIPLIRSLPQYGPLVRVGLGPNTLWMITDLDLARTLNLGKAGEFHRDMIIEAVRPFTGRSLVTLSGTAHRTRRRLIAPAFHANRIAMYAETFAEVAEQWVAGLPVGVPFDPGAAIDQLALDTLTQTLIGGAASADARAVVRRESPRLLREASIRTVLPLRLAEARHRSHQEFLRRSARMRDAVASVLAEYRRHPVDRGDLLSQLAVHVDPRTGQRLSDTEIIDELVGFVMGGIESPAGMLLALLHELIHAPEVCNEVLAEIDAVVGDGPVRAAHAHQLPVLRRALLETMRLWAPWISLLTSRTQFTIGALELPAGTMVGLSAHMIHHNPRYFPHPQEFRPQRWLDGHEGERTDTAAIPFGVGQRNCPADLFSWSALTIQAAAVLRQRLPVAGPGEAPRDQVRYLTKGVGVRPRDVELVLYPRR